MNVANELAVRLSDRILPGVDVNMVLASPTAAGLNRQIAENDFRAERLNKLGWCLGLLALVGSTVGVIYWLKK